MPFDTLLPCFFCGVGCNFLIVFLSSFGELEEVAISPNPKSSSAVLLLSSVGVVDDVGVSFGRIFFSLYL